MCRAEPVAVPADGDRRGMVLQAVQDRGGDRRVTEYHMMPLTLIGESLTLRLLTPIPPFFESHLRVAERNSYRKSGMVVVILPDKRERSVPCAATDLAEASSRPSIIYPQACISARSLLPLANRLRIMLRCQDEGCSGEALGAEEHLHGPRRDLGFDLVPGKAVGHRVMVPLNSNVVVEPHPATSPFGMNPEFVRQWLQVRRIDLLEQLAACLSATSSSCRSAASSLLR